MCRSAEKEPELRKIISAFDESHRNIMSNVSEYGQHADDSTWIDKEYLACCIYEIVRVRVLCAPCVCVCAGFICAYMCLRATFVNLSTFVNYINFNFFLFILSLFFFSFLLFYPQFGKEGKEGGKPCRRHSSTSWNTVPEATASEASVWP